MRGTRRRWCAAHARKVETVADYYEVRKQAEDAIRNVERERLVGQIRVAAKFSTQMVFLHDYEAKALLAVVDALRDLLAEPQEPVPDAVVRECGGRCHDALDSRSPCPACAADLSAPDAVVREALRASAPDAVREAAEAARLDLMSYDEAVTGDEKRHALMRCKNALRDVLRTIDSALAPAAARRDAEEVFRAILDYEPHEVCKDEFAYDRMVENYRDAARKGLALLAAEPGAPVAPHPNPDLEKLVNVMLAPKSPARDEVREAAERLFRALDHACPDWREETCVIGGDDVNLAWCALEAALDAAKGGKP